MSVIFTAGIALVGPALISLVGQFGGQSRGIAVSVYTFVLFGGTSLGPIIAIQFMRTDSFSRTFILLALVRHRVLCRLSESYRSSQRGRKLMEYKF